MKKNVYYLGQWLDGLPHGKGMNKTLSRKGLFSQWIILLG
jgi:hypothetical protein